MKVLFIEDHEDYAAFIREAMLLPPPTGVEMDIAHDLAAGLLKLNSGHYDVVLLDLGLPDSTGIDTFLTLNDAFPTMPVVVLSGIMEKDAFRQALARGAACCICKHDMRGVDQTRRRLIHALEKAVANMEIHTTFLNISRTIQACCA